MITRHCVRSGLQHVRRRRRLSTIRRTKATDRHSESAGEEPADTSVGRSHVRAGLAKRRDRPRGAGPSDGRKDDRYRGPSTVDRQERGRHTRDEGISSALTAVLERTLFRFVI